MQILTSEDILKATGGRIISGGELSLEFDGITTDSRAVKNGMLFIPLAGERFDGHDYIVSAAEHGVSAALTHKEETDACGIMLIKVDDTRKALGDIARYYKQKYFVPSVAITGSVGKTTTKDMISAVLSEHFRTLKTPNNFNNDIGVPLTIFGLEKEHEMAVIEMGMNHFGEIEYLSGIALPDAAVITNIGMSHIENLGSQEGIFKAKMEITSRFGSENTLFVNGDDKFLKNVSSDVYSVVKYGLDQSCDIYAKDIVNNGLSGISFTAVCRDTEFKAEVTQPGIHNVYNALAAIAVGMHFGVTAEECVSGLKNCVYTSQRLEVITHGNIEVINDCYNSSPDSVRAALKVQQQSLMKRRIAVLGDILEMGEFAPKAHYELGADVASAGVDMLITVGENASKMADGARDAGMTNIVSYEKTDDIIADLPELLKDGGSVLVKASHGMHFEKITNAIKEI